MLKKIGLGFVLAMGLLYGAVDINNASLKELTTIKGIGEKKAKSIIEYRSKECFAKPSDIIKVKGIGEKTYEKIKKDITAGKCKNKPSNNTKQSKK